MIKIIAFIRIIYILSAVVNTLVYLFALSTGDLVLLLQLWQPMFVLSLYMLCTAMHTHGLLQTCCCTCKSKKKAPEDEWRITSMFSSFKKWCDLHYDYFLVGREMLEIPIWTVQCFYFGQPIRNWYFCLHSCYLSNVS